MNKKKIIIVYHSGVGNTKMVAEKICEVLSHDFEITMYSIERLPNRLNLREYDGVVIGFPTIHTHPTRCILQFLDELSPLKEMVPAFIFTTCGLYSANTLRTFAKRCMTKNIVPIINNTYRCAATDGILLASFMKCWFKLEKGLDNKISTDCGKFTSKIKSHDHSLNMPRFKLYSILNYPNSLLGNCVTLPIYTHKEKCIKCGKCTRNCPARSLTKDKEGYPVFLKNKCEKCYRCIHHCPQLALSLSKNKTPKKVLDIN